MSELVNIIKKFKGKNIAIIGDIMLDKFLMGRADRMSSEAPVPIVSIDSEYVVPGGAANVAVNINSLGGRSHLISVIGRDSASAELLKSLKLRRVNTDGIFKISGRPTTEKIRLISGDKQIARIDRESSAPIGQIFEDKILKIVKTNIKKWDCIILSDYSKGLFSEKLAQGIISIAGNNSKSIFVDTKPSHFSYFKNVFLITPNHKEVTEASGISDIRQAAKAINKRLNCNILVTQGEDGMTLLEKGHFYHFSAVEREVSDIVGAGDTVIASLALAYVSGLGLPDSASLANHAASISVSKFGTAASTGKELKESLIKKP